MALPKRSITLPAKEQEEPAEGFIFPSGLVLQSAELVHGTSGDVYHIQANSSELGRAELTQSYAKHGLKQIRKIKAPDLRIGEGASLGPTNGELTQQSRPKVAIEHRPIGISERMRAEHRERVDQARREIDDPLALMRNLTARRWANGDTGATDTDEDDDWGTLDIVER